MQQNRFVSDQSLVEQIDGTNVPARRMLTADLSTLQASFRVYGRSEDYEPRPRWNIDQAKTRNETSQNGKEYQQCYGNTETVKLGEGQLQYSHRINPHTNHAGDFYMEELPFPGNYTGIYNTLSGYTGSSRNKPNKKNEMNMAGWMLRYSKTGAVVSLTELQSIYPESKQEDLNQLMRIFFHCLVKEPMSWMMPAMEDHELPFATAQARAVKLISEGFLTLEDVFDQYAPYGVFTGKNIGKDISVIREKIDKINKAYEEFILTPRESPNFQPYYSFKCEQANREIVTSRSHLHKELVEMYGGKEDSDGEGYDSDTAETLYKTVFEFK